MFEVEVMDGVTILRYGSVEVPLKDVLNIEIHEGKLRLVRTAGDPVIVPIDEDVSPSDALDALWGAIVEASKRVR